MQRDVKIVVERGTGELKYKVKLVYGDRQAIPITAIIEDGLKAPLMGNERIFDVYDHDDEIGLLEFPSSVGVRVTGERAENIRKFFENLLKNKKRVEITPSKDSGWYSLLNCFRPLMNAMVDGEPYFDSDKVDEKDLYHRRKG